MNISSVEERLDQLEADLSSLKNFVEDVYAILLEVKQQTEGLSVSVIEERLGDLESEVGDLKEAQDEA